MSQIHKCSSCLVHCMDWRIQNTLIKLLQELGEETADRISIPGGAGKYPELVDEWVALSCKLHDPKQIILTVHEDCGAGATKNDLIESLARVKKNNPDRDVKAFFVMLDGRWQEVS